MRLAIAIPHYNGQVHIALLRTMTTLNLAGTETILLDHSNPALIVGRNTLVQSFLDHPFGGTHLFFVDSDMGLPPQAVQMLLGADKPIVSGLAVEKPSCLLVPRKQIGPWLYDLVHRDWCEPPGNDGVHWRLKPEYHNQVLPVDAGGAACLLVRRKVFENVPYPWFYNEFNPQATGQRDGSCLGEDLTFFRKAAAYGFKGYVHTGVLCEHWSGGNCYPPFWV